jgi:hypothetical protein
VSLAVALAAAPAAALPYTATLGISFGPLGQIQFPGTGSGTSTAAVVTLPGGTFSGAELVGLEPTPVFISFLASVSGNGAGIFSGNPLAGRLPVFGRVAGRIADGGGPLTAFTVPLFNAHGPGSTVQTVGLGVGGTSSRVVSMFPSIYVKVFHTGWTTGMRTFTGVVEVYTFHQAYGFAASLALQATTVGTAMYTGSDSRTPGGLGQLTLISPTKVATTVVGAPFHLVILGELTLSFVPEPSTGLLAACGMALLALIGRRRSAGRA